MLWRISSFFFFSSRRRHTRCSRDWSSDVCSSDLAIRRPVIRIEPSIYLDALVQDFLLFGGRIVIRKFDTPRDLMSVSEPVIINCTGLGSQMLFGDQELIPLKGQLTHFVPQPEINYQTASDARNPGLRGSIGIHMMPRSDGLALGGTSERGVWTLEPNEEARREIVEQHIQLFAAMRLANA